MSSASRSGSTPESARLALVLGGAETKISSPSSSSSSALREPVPNPDPGLGVESVVPGEGIGRTASSRARTEVDFGIGGIFRFINESLESRASRSSLVISPSLLVDASRQSRFGGEINSPASTEVSGSVFSEIRD
jgi:hypothetical protein